MRARRGYWRVCGRLGAFALLLALGLCGCGEPILAPGQGQLVLPWEVLPTGCEDAGLSRVRLSLWMLTDGAAHDAAHDAADVVFEAPCAQGELSRRLDYGAYTLRLEGLDAADDPLFIAHPAAVVVIQPEATLRLEPLMLEPRPATLDVIWRFEDGALCGAHHVEQVEVLIFDPSGYMSGSREVRCALGRARFEGLKAGQYSALVRAGAGMGGLVEVTLEVAKRRGVEVMLRVTD